MDQPAISMCPPEAKGYHFTAIVCEIMKKVEWFIPLKETRETQGMNMELTKTETTS